METLTDPTPAPTAASSLGLAVSPQRRRGTTADPAAAGGVRRPAGGTAAFAG